MDWKLFGVLSIPEPWRRDKKHTTSWIQSHTVANHDVFLLSHALPRILLNFNLFCEI